jgi:hypothetical protein
MKEMNGIILTMATVYEYSLQGWGLLLSVIDILKFNGGKTGPS